MKNIKGIFFALTILTLLLAVSTVTAADNTAANSSVVSDTITTHTDTSSDSISIDKLPNIHTNEKIENTKNIKKEEENNNPNIKDTNSISTKTIIKQDTNKNIKTSTIEVNNYNGLVDAVNAAKQSNDDTYTINLSSGIYTATNPMTWGAATGNVRKLIINGNGMLLDGGDTYQFMSVDSGYTLEVNNISFTHYAASNGSVIYSNGVTIINNCNFVDNTAVYKGGAIYINNGYVTVNASNFTYNKATTYDGGAIYVYLDSSVTVTSSNFTSNVAGYSGGALYNYGGSATITDCIFRENNGTTDRGGAIVSLYTGSSLIVNDSQFINNSAVGGGGAIYGYNIMTITNTSFINNTVTTSGGAICVDVNDYNITITDCDFITNHAVNNEAGAIYAHQSNLYLTRSTFTGNTAAQNGGAIIMGKYLSADNCEFTNNFAGENGGAILGVGPMKVKYSNFTENSAYQGGAIFAKKNDYELDVDHCDFTNNHATDKGGAIFAYECDIEVSNSTFTDNNVGNNAGAILTGKVSRILNCEFVNNHASDKGGALLCLGDSFTKNSRFIDNSAWAGGAIATNSTYTIWVESCEFINNSANYQGGAIYTYLSKLDASYSTFTGNTAGESGGAILSGKPLTVYYCNFYSNSAGTRGGAIHRADGSFSITYSTFINNSPADFKYKNRIIFSNNTDTSGFIREDTVSIYSEEEEMIIATGQLEETLITDYYVIYTQTEMLNYEPHMAVITGTTHNSFDVKLAPDCYVHNAHELKLAVENNFIQDGTYCISLLPGDYNLTEEINFPKIVDNGTVIIILGNGQVVDGLGGDHFINLVGASIITDSVIFTNFSTDYGILDGAAIVINTTFIKNSAKNCIFSDLYHNLDGVNYDCQPIKIYDSKFINNTGYLMDIRSPSRVIITGSTFINNRETNNDGLLYLANHKPDELIISITDSVFVNNTGRVINNKHGTVNIANSIFTGNSADKGGAIYTLANVNIVNSTFTSNRADRGSAIYSKSSVNIVDSTFNDNQATDMATILIEGGSLNIQSSTFKNNSARLYTTILNFGNYLCNVTDCLFDANHATNEGILANTGNLIIDNSNFTNNVAYKHSTIYNEGSTNISNCVFIGNTPLNFDTYINGFNLFTDDGFIPANATLNIIIDDTTQTVEMINGNVGYNVIPYEGCTAQIILNPEDETSNARNLTFIVKEKPIPTKFSLDMSNNTRVGESIDFKGRLYEATGGSILPYMNITIIIDDVEYNLTTESDGLFGFHITYHIAGSKTVTVRFRGTTTLEPSEINITFNVEAGNANVEVNEINTKINDVVNLTAYVTDCQNKNINRGTVTFTNNQGKTLATVQVIAGIATTLYTFTSEYNGTIIATFTSDDYQTTTAENTLLVRKINTILTLNSTKTDLVVGDSIELTGKLVDEDNKALPSKNINITINNMTYPLTTNGEGIVTLTHIPTSETTEITALFNGDDTYNASEYTININVAKFNSTVNLTTPTTAYVGDNITITVNVKDNNNKAVTGNVTIKVDKTPIKTITLNNGQATTTITINTDGTHNITTTYNGDTNTSTNTTTNTIQLNKKNTKINASTMGNIVDNTTITITVTDLTNNGQIANPLVTIYENNKEIANTTTNILKINLTGGNHILSIKYDGNNIYNPSETTLTMDIAKLNSTINLTVPTTAYVGDKITISVNVKNQNNKAATGNVTIKVDNTIIGTLTLNKGQITTTTTINTQGTHNITATYNENENTTTNTTTNTIQLNKKNTKTIATITSNIIDNTTIKITVTDSTTNKTISNPLVTIYENNKQIANTTNNTIKLNLTLGSHTLNIKYDGNGTYNPSETTLTINVTKLNSTVSLTVPTSAYVEDKITININVKNQNNKAAIGNVTIKVDNTIIGTLTLNNGQTNITTTINTQGTHNLTATYNGNTNTNTATSKKTVEVNKKNTKVNATTTSSRVDNTIIAITVTDLTSNKEIANPWVIVYENDKQIANTSTKTVKLNLTAGSHRLNIKYDGNNIYNASETTLTINVTKLNSTVILTVPTSAYVEDKITININVKDQNNKAATGNVTIKVDNTTIGTLTLNNGQISTTTTINTQAAHNITATYNGNANTNTATSNKKIQVNKKNTKITATVKTSIVNNTNIEITLTDNNNKAVSKANIIVTDKNNKQIATTTTNANGKATIKLNLASGKQVINIKYNGNNTYNPTNKTLTINVDKLNTTINIKSNNTSPRVNDKVQLTITLKDNNNKAMTNKTIEVTVNNKNYNVTTDNTGTTTVNYTMNKNYANLTATATYNGDSTYKSSTKTLALNRTYTTDVKLLTGSFDTKPGDTVKLIAHITDNRLDINGGQLVFKIDGKTLADESGKAVKVNIQKGFAILEYKIPDTLSAGTRNLSATFSSGKYSGRLSTPMLINKLQTHIDVNPLYTTNNNIIVKAQVVDQNNQALNKQTAICIKFNGKSYNFNTTTGTINYKITQTLKDGYYNLTIISGANGKYQSTTATTVVIKTNTTIKTNYINNTLNNKTSANSGDIKIGTIMSLLTGASTVKPGDTLKIIAHVTKDSIDITGGQLGFKIDGLTLNDSKNNKVFKPQDGLAILEYKVPDTLSAGTRTLSAVYSSKQYGNERLNSTLTMNKLNTHIESQPLYTTTATPTIKAQILDDNNQLINKETTVVIKIDGKSYTMKNTNGIINYKVPTNLTKGLHQITIIAGENGKYLSSRANTVVIRT